MALVKVGESRCDACGATPAEWFVVQPKGPSLDGCSAACLREALGKLDGRLGSVLGCPGCDAAGHACDAHRFKEKTCCVWPSKFGHAADCPSQTKEVPK